MTMPLRIALTQRVDVSPFGERRDALDQAWAAMIERFGHIMLPLANNVRAPAAYIEAVAPDAVILTGGGDIATLPGAANPAPERDRMDAAAVEYCKARRIPLLAVCRGFQFLNFHLGGRLERAQGHVAVPHGLTGTAFGDVESVNSFHNWLVPEGGLASDLIGLATAPDGSIEAARHKTLPWLALMWHPERSISCPERHEALVLDTIEGRIAKAVSP